MENVADTPIVCFSCGRPINEGSSFICVNRLYRVRRASSEDKIVEGMASLQICGFCASQARKKEIAFNETPIPLLKLEKEGFYSFVRKSGTFCQPHMPEGKIERCRFCGTAITDGKHYIKIHAEEIKKGHCKIVPGSTHVMATACSECAQTYMIWL